MSDKEVGNEAQADAEYCPFRLPFGFAMASDGYEVWVDGADGNRRVIFKGNEADAGFVWDALTIHARAPLATQDGGWQPIETAPNGLYVLVVAGAWIGVTAAINGWWGRGDQNIRIHPTHWMPLPNPPSGALAGTKRGKR